jgi:hypothetical protein
MTKGEAALSAALVKDVLKIELRNTGKANLKLREWVVTREGRRTPQGAVAAYVLVRQHADGRLPPRRSRPTGP